MSNSELPSIGFALPLNSENRWSDLLAVLISTDPGPITQLFRIEVAPEQVRVEREVSVGKANRTDLILRVDDRRTAVIEVKVLAGLGPKQLLRYEQAEPGADRYIVVHPERLVVHTKHAPRWEAITWEEVLAVYVNSSHPWVRDCALAWQAHLERALPKVDANTRWGGLIEGEPFVVAMRARASWVFANLVPPDGVEHDLVNSSAGASWPVRLYVRTAKPGYLAMVDVEERMGVRSIPKFANATRPPLGPSVKVALVQENVTTSAAFDWDYLLAMWPLMAAARDDWVQRTASPKHPHDKAAHKAMVDKGGPKHLGIGFGDAQTKINGQCLFGARFQLPPDITLEELVTTLEETGELLLAMAKVKPTD